MKARLREEIVVTMSVTEARKLYDILPEWIAEAEDVLVINSLQAALDSVLGTEKVDHTLADTERGL